MEIPQSLRPAPGFLPGLPCASVAVHAGDIHQSPDELKQLHFEQLRQTKVRSVSPGHVGVDKRLAFHLTKRLELSVVAQNIFDSRHPEFAGGAAHQPEVPHTIDGQLTWRM